MLVVHLPSECDMAGRKKGGKDGKGCRTEDEKGKMRIKPKEN